MKKLFLFESIAFAILSVFVLAFRGICGFDSTTFVGFLAALIAGFIGYLKFKIEDDRFFKELFITFNKRYDTKMNDVINRLRRDEGLQDKSANDRDDYLVITDYLNLCAEEFLWVKKGRIPKDVWEAWRSGILENLKIEKVRKVYDDETKTPEGKKSYYGLFEELKKYRDSSVPADSQPSL